MKVVHAQFSASRFSSLAFRAVVLAYHYVRLQGLGQVGGLIRLNEHDRIHALERCQQLGPIRRLELGTFCFSDKRLGTIDTERHY